MPRSRTIPWLITLLAAAAFCISIVPLTIRLRDFNASAGFVRFHAEPIMDRSFQIGNFPAVALTDAQTESGQAALKLTYSGKSELIPVMAPPAKDLPSLGLYEEWAKVLAINEVVLDDQKNSAAKPGSERLLIVVRRTPEGFDPESWGEVRRIEWVFDFYDLKPDGSIEKSQRRWPRKQLAEARLEREAKGMEGTPVNERSKQLFAIPVLKDRTAEFFAALHVMPKLSVPEHKFTDTAFSPRVLGWTLPVSMLSVLAFVGGLIFALAPRRRA